MHRFVLLISSLLVLIPFAIANWQHPSQPPNLGPESALMIHPRDRNKLIAASGSQLYEREANGAWKNLGRMNQRGTKIDRLLSFEERPEEIFILSRDGAFAGTLKDHNWRPIFQRKNPKEKAVLSFAIVPGEPEHWLVGTKAGLFESLDEGKTWYRFSRFSTREAIPILRFVGTKLFLATHERLYFSEDFAAFRPVFSLTSGEDLEFLELEETLDEEDLDLGAQDFHDLAGAAQAKKLWLATEKGVFESEDQGKHWTQLSRSGFKSTRIQHLVYAEKSDRLFAGTADGVYVYLPQEKRWQGLFEGLARPQTYSLQILKDPEMLVALTGDGFVEHSLFPEKGSPSVWIPSPERMQLFQNLVQLEPSAREMHKAVIRYSNLKNSKIKRWHAQSRLRSLIPSFNFGYDFSRADNIDIDRGSTTEPDKFIFGPEDQDKGWDMDMRWDLASLIWDTNQTSIDSREKLMVELRQDFLSEATRIYYERRRLQTEIVFTEPASEQGHMERLIRLDELTALLDAMTGGEFSKKLEEIYRENWELNKLWAYEPVRGSNAELQHRSNADH